jgi:hypothetical protein
MAAFSFLSEVDLYGDAGGQDAGPAVAAPEGPPPRAPPNKAPPPPPEGRARHQKAVAAAPAEAKSEALASRRDLETLSLYVDYLERRFNLLEQQRQHADRRFGGNLGLPWALVLVLGLALLLLWGRRPGAQLYMPPAPIAPPQAFLAPGNNPGAAYFAIPTPGAPPPVSFLPR